MSSQHKKNLDLLEGLRHLGLSDENITEVLQHHCDKVIRNRELERAPEIKLLANLSGLALTNLKVVKVIRVSTNATWLAYDPGIKKFYLPDREDRACMLYAVVKNDIYVWIPPERNKRLRKLVEDTNLAPFLYQMNSLIDQKEMKEPERVTFIKPFQAAQCLIGGGRMFSPDVEIDPRVKSYDDVKVGEYLLISAEGTASFIKFKNSDEIRRVFDMFTDWLEESEEEVNEDVIVVEKAKEAI